MDSRTRHAALSKMTVPQLKALVRKHNLHTSYMKGYSKLRKEDLIKSFIKHTEGKFKVVPEAKAKPEAKPKAKPKAAARKPLPIPRGKPDANSPVAKEAAAREKKARGEKFTAKFKAAYAADVAAHREALGLNMSEEEKRERRIAAYRNSKRAVARLKARLKREGRG